MASGAEGGTGRAAAEPQAAQKNRMRSLIFDEVDEELAQAFALMNPVGLSARDTKHATSGRVIVLRTNKCHQQHFIRIGYLDQHILYRPGRHTVVSV